MQVETVLLAIQSGIVTLELVLEEEDKAMLLENIDVGAVTPVPRVWSPQRNGAFYVRPSG